MNRELGYLLTMALAICLFVAGWTSKQPARTQWRETPLAVQAAPDPSMTSGESTTAPRTWHGVSLLAPLLNVDLRSQLSVSPVSQGRRDIEFSIGSEAGRADGIPAIESSRDTVLAWKGAGQAYELVIDKSDASARLYVSRHRVRYLVKLTLEDARHESSLGRFAARLAAVAEEAWTLLRPRAIGLVLTYAIVAGAFYLLYWVLLRKRLAARKIQSESPKKGAVLFEIRHSFIALLATALFSYGLVSAVETGHTKLYRDVAEYGWGYWFFSLVLLLILVDAYVYWTHRLMHHRALFKYFHKVHHHSYRPTPWATFSVNVNEIIVNALFMPLVVLVLPVHQNTTIVFAIVSILKNVLNHLGYEVFPRGANKGLLRWVVSPTYHELHHLKFDTNFGAYFTWWDKWMGTEHAGYEAKIEQLQGQAVTTT